MGQISVIISRNPGSVLSANQHPIDLRVRTEPDKDPVGGVPFSSRNIVEAYRSGAERFGWDKRNAAPGRHREGEWLIGMGCATATYRALAVSSDRSTVGKFST